MDHMNPSTFVVVNAKTGDVVTANRDHNAAEELGEQIAEFDLYGQYYIQEVTLH